MSFWSKSPLENLEKSMFERNKRFNRYLDFKKNEILPNYLKPNKHKWGMFHGIKICDKCGVVYRSDIGACPVGDNTYEIKVKTPSLWQRIKILLKI